MAGYNIKRNINKTILYIIVIIISFIFIFPFLWMLLSSLKFNKDVLALPIRFFPPSWNWKSYYNVFFEFPGFDFLRYILNSFIVTFFAVLLCLFFSATSGYGFAKYKFKGNSFLFTVILSTIMISFGVIAVPLFILVRKMGMQNSYPGLIIPESLTAFGVFMMRQFFYSIPDDVIESARIDGANEYMIFSKISIPIAKTALLALVIFHAQWVWNLLLWPLIVISTPEMRTLPQGIALFKGGYNTPYPEQLAVSVIACIPMLILYMFLSKYFVQGITMTGLKG
ncbi:MAG: carbohydrate ABC transporter permease [Spirochaetales bacterium]|nr:carbohydrate ABC transporter permease [Spirochaetales bacterium]RKX81707.1 MAG: carbohydrate ABC transporter permease [Spirochaetota bacterium]